MHGALGKLAPHDAALLTQRREKPPHSAVHVHVVAERPAAHAPGAANGACPPPRMGRRCVARRRACKRMTRVGDRCQRVGDRTRQAGHRRKRGAPTRSPP
eukprot:1681409-Prymnesium_polylepis.2